MAHGNLPLLMLLIAASWLVTACATKADLNTSGIDENLTAQVAYHDIKAATGQRVLWGGMIMGAKNQPDKTIIEVLAFPLDESHRPNADATATVRFIAEHGGYLELIDYTQGRWLTVTGTVRGSRTGTVGEAAYEFPVVLTDGMHLWPKETGGRTNTQFHFGIGIGIHR